MAERTGSGNKRSGEKRSSGSQLAAIGSAGGVFSGLFGVGGGTVMVPLLVLWRGFGEKRATGTSLLAIALVALFAAGGNLVFGEVDVVKSVLIGLPAIAGVIFGTTVQQRIPDRVLAGMFSVLVLVIAAVYVLD